MREIMFRGPEPPEGARWCAFCSMVFKFQVIQAAEAEMQVAMRAEGAQPYWVDMERVAAKAGIRLPMHAVTIALCQPLGNALTELCWSHVTGLKVQNGMVLPASPADVAAMSSQPVPLLGGR